LLYFIINKSKTSSIDAFFLSGITYIYLHVAVLLHFIYARLNSGW
jgi:hypothetical protein